MRSIHSDKTLEADMTKTIQPMACAYQGCKKAFTPTRSWQRFCSPECKADYWTELRKEVAVEIMRRKKEVTIW
jgi:hypothetical protein